MSHAPAPGDGSGIESVVLLLLLLLPLEDLPEELDRRPVRLGRDAEARLLSLKCVSRCCFMLSARVNFLLQPANVHCTAFSAV